MKPGSRAFASSSGTRPPPARRDPCDGDGDCESGDCGGGTCEKGGFGTPCASGTDCLSNNCPSTSCGKGDTDGDGTQCTADEHWVSSDCDDGSCTDPGLTFRALSCPSDDHAFPYNQFYIDNGSSSTVTLADVGVLYYMTADGEGSLAFSINSNGSNPPQDMAATDVNEGRVLKVELIGDGTLAAGQSTTWKGFGYHTDWTEQDRDNDHSTSACSPGQPNPNAVVCQRVDGYWYRVWGAPGPKNGSGDTDDTVCGYFGAQ